MKSILKFSILSFVALSVLFSMPSCSSDDDLVIDPGPVGIAVSDGIYMASTTAEPTASNVLVAEQVEDGGYASQDRDGFIANYMFLAGGSYNIVEIKDKEITATWGGTAETIDDGNSGCGFVNYSVATLEADGAAIAAGAGLYKVTYDNMTKEMVMHKIESAAVIGDATPNGWGTDTSLDLVGSITADGASWSKTEVEMTQGQFKVRFNCRWVIDRRITQDNFLPENKYQMFTNFGGTTSQLVTGGSNIPLDDTERGVYTITVAWTPAGGFGLTMEKTGEIVVEALVPSEHNWAITGDATPNGWPDDDMSNDPIGTDHDLPYVGELGGEHIWQTMSIDLSAGEFKFRQNDNWDDPNFGVGQMTIEGDISEISGSGNFVLSAAGAGNYTIVMKTGDEGLNYTANFTKN